MKLYRIYYGFDLAACDNINDIEVTEYEVKETKKFYIIEGHRFPKTSVNVVRTIGDGYHKIAVYTLSDTLDIMEDFKKQIIVTIDKALMNHNNGLYFLNKELAKLTEGMNKEDIPSYDIYDYDVEFHW